MSEDVKKLLEMMKNPALSNSLRLGILISLYVLKRTSFSSLQKSLGVPKSSLHASLQVLEESGLIRVRKLPTPLGPRTFIELTDEGNRVIKEYMSIIKKIE
ncbi:ArsR family transcriptional regulator [Sulfolobus sp. A20]|uniref:winged helix-turn-helix domain-containing protein n=1 Tax=Sulfolobaceae TaxID=118883 RepID=UPI0008460598|nr:MULTISPECIES: helix-turn-helix domain-containing protein [unclassified Sulfolobus]TRM73939.1 ArsR family transcriptional regulator [Sulfolobus sp. E5]TRM74442.1 ArsR family transcriptional regulator [Sulfolobus sp. A20-N-F8]TRM86585.1 ArsR family transcriptional regulator [Sulfolobus sp. C3]TRM97385.1 ArsR family transcriptional regulator [Sulfolobus sp. E1]TRM99023.1 ArsR family transcriptional regulator [Sulfolobus sp. F1]